MDPLIYVLHNDLPNDLQMSGNVKKQMVRGIDYAQCVIVFITRRYVDKVKGENAEDNCQVQFYAETSTDDYNVL